MSFGLLSGTLYKGVSLYNTQTFGEQNPYVELQLGSEKFTSHSK